MPSLLPSMLRLGASICSVSHRAAPGPGRLRQYRASRISRTEASELRGLWQGREQVVLLGGGNVGQDGLSAAHTGKSIHC